jgi:hypothetical protein
VKKRRFKRPPNPLGASAPRGAAHSLLGWRPHASVNGETDKVEQHSRCCCSTHCKEHEKGSGRRVLGWTYEASCRASDVQGSPTHADTTGLMLMLQLHSIQWIPTCYSRELTSAPYRCSTAGAPGPHQRREVWVWSLDETLPKHVL